MNRLVALLHDNPISRFPLHTTNPTPVSSLIRRQRHLAAPDGSTRQQTSRPLVDCTLWFASVRIIVEIVVLGRLKYEQMSYLVAISAFLISSSTFPAEDLDWFPLPPKF